MAQKREKRQTLAEKTRELCVHRRRTITMEMIANHLGCTPNWVSLFATGRIANPSADKIQMLYEYLAEKQLDY